MENNNINLEKLSAEDLFRIKKSLEQGVELPNLKDINLDNLNLEPLDINNHNFVRSIKNEKI